MRFNNHERLVGQHAFLSASVHHWTNYSPEKLVDRYRKHRAAAYGTRLHEYAKESILLGERMPKVRRTLNLYINDCISFGMTPEQVLFYSVNCFGTADAISFRDGTLRIFDLKTGVSPASMRQLLVYAAMFCLEYRIKPGTINIELRIYKDNDIQILNPAVADVLEIMDIIVVSDKIIEQVKMEG